MKTGFAIGAGLLALVLAWLVYQQAYVRRMVRHLQTCLQSDYSRYDLHWETSAAMYRARRSEARAHKETQA